MALVTSVIVVFIILITAAATSNTGFSGFFDAENISRKDFSRSLAEGCVSHALLYLADGDYEGNETVVVGGYTCTVEEIIIGGDEITIGTSALFRGAHTRLVAVVDTFNLSEISLVETE